MLKSLNEYFKNETNTIKRTLVLLLAIVIYLLFIGFLVQVAWNIVGPEVFGLKEISILHGVALVILSEILIKNTCNNICMSK